MTARPPDGWRKTRNRKLLRALSSASPRRQNPYYRNAVDWNEWYYLSSRNAFRSALATRHYFDVEAAKRAAEESCKT